jgi:NADH-quinone oxidoreductase subunit N
MLSLTGIPPAAGFVGKFFIFQATLQAGLIALAIVGVVTSLISAYYYLRVVIIMYMRDTEDEPAVTLQPALRAALVLTGLGTFVLGVIPTPMFDLVRQSLLTLYG